MAKIKIELLMTIINKLKIVQPRIKIYFNNLKKFHTLKIVSVESLPKSLAISLWINDYSFGWITVIDGVFFWRVILNLKPMIKYC